MEAKNTFQKYLISQGYTREFYPFGAWMKDGKIVSGKELNDKLYEFKTKSK